VSERFEGLSLPELLDLMHELVEPEAVPWLPQTPGWWVLLGWALTVATLIIASIIRRRRRNRYRREALASLDAIAAHPQMSAAESAQRVAEIIKRTALVAFPRARVASMHGGEWARFLCESCGNDRQVTEAAESLASAAYRPDADGRSILQPARRWVRLHRA
jgi:hypothetical protein